MNTKFEVAGVEATTPLGIAAPALLLAKAGPLFDLEARARGGADADAVHDMRVASRRLREALRLLTPLYPSHEMRALYRRVRKITRVLGPVRDADVFIETFSALSFQVGKAGKRAAAYLIGYRAGQREYELAALNEHLVRLDLKQARKAFSTAVCAVTSTDDASRPLSAFAHDAVAERSAIVFAAQPAALEEHAADQQHALRIAYKRLRYAVETFAPCYGDDFDVPHAVLTAFQDALGELHDAHVFCEVLQSPELLERAAPAGVSAASIDEIVSVLQAQARSAYRDFSKLAARYPADLLLPQLLGPLESATLAR